jgi:hypothetical protein
VEVEGLASQSGTFVDWKEVIGSLPIPVRRAKWRRANGRGRIIEAHDATRQREMGERLATRNGAEKRRQNANVT